MKPLRPIEGGISPREHPLAEVTTALAAGRLADLLRGRGLTQRTVEELLRPESAVTLRSILTRHLYPVPGERDALRGPGLDSSPSVGGKVLAFTARRSLGR